MNENKYKIIINREKQFVACLIGFKIYVDDKYVGKVKNGKTLVVEVTPGQHVISVNKMNAVMINVNSDVVADTIVFGPNNFGINNIRLNGEETPIDSNQDYSKRYTIEANTNLIFCVIIPVIYFLLADKSTVWPIWLTSMFIGYGIINIAGLKKIKNNKKVYKACLIKNLISMIIATIFVILFICKYAGI